MLRTTNSTTIWYMSANLLRFLKRRIWKTIELQHKDEFRHLCRYGGRGAIANALFVGICKNQLFAYQYDEHLVSIPIRLFVERFELQTRCNEGASYNALVDLFIRDLVSSGLHYVRDFRTTNTAMSSPRALVRSNTTLVANTIQATKCSMTYSWYWRLNVSKTCDFFFGVKLSAHHIYISDGHVHTRCVFAYALRHSPFLLFQETPSIPQLQIRQPARCTIWGKVSLS